MIGVGTLVAVALAVAVFDAGAGASEAPPRWDRRVRPIATKVERLRGLTFKHPVPIIYTSSRQFRRLLADLSRSGMERYGSRAAYRDEVMLRGLGLMGSGSSIAELQAQSATNVLAFYDPADQRIVIRGHDVGIGTEATLAHELTHVLQDQYFDIRAHQLRRRDIDAIQTYSALIEGDATRIAAEYIKSLSASQRAAALKVAGDDAEQLTLGRDPWASFAFGGGPYLFGTQMVRALTIDDGERGVNLAFRRPPQHQAEVMNPLALLDRFVAIDVPEPKLRHGERRVGPTTPIGAMTLYVALAGRVDPASAMYAADDWGGSSAVAFIRDGDACVRAAFRTEHPDGTQVLLEALKAWVSFGPEGTGSVVENSGEITLETCEQIGMTYDLPGIDEVVLPLLVRNQLMLSKVEDGLSKDDAKCIADELMFNDEYLDNLFSDSADGEHTPEELEVLRQHVADATEYCQTGEPRI